MTKLQNIYLGLSVNAPLHVRFDLPIRPLIIHNLGSLRITVYFKLSGLPCLNKVFSFIHSSSVVMCPYQYKYRYLWRTSLLLCFYKTLEHSTRLHQVFVILYLLLKPLSKPIFSKRSIIVSFDINFVEYFK